MLCKRICLTALLVTTGVAMADKPRPHLYSMGRFTAAWAARPWSYDTALWEHMEAMGATMSGGGLAWVDGEPVRGQYNMNAFAYADHEVDGIRAHGMEVAFFLGLTPQWAKLHPDLDPHRTPPKEEFAADFIAFHQYVANYFKGRVKYYYFWNEPNGCSWINEGCGNSDSYPEYTKWLIRCSEAVKSVDPDAKIIAPRLDYHAGVTHGYQYIQGMYAHGAGPHIDGVAIHPYDWSGTIHWQALRDVRSVMVSNGDGHKPIWITEYGWNSTDYQSTSDKMVYVLEELRKPEWFFVEKANYLVLNDGAGVFNYGLMDQNLNPRAGYWAFTNIDKTWPDTVEFSGNVLSGSAPLTVQFTNESYIADQVAWHWTFGDGSTSNLEHPTHTYTQEGRYTVMLAVTNGSGSRNIEKVDYIKVGDAPRIAFIGGEVPTTPADTAIVQHMASQGLLVDVYDDEPGNRPTAADIAASHDLVIGSSTVLSANVAGEFRNESTPFIYWEPALSWASREALAEGQEVEWGQTQLNIIDNTHPVMDGFGTGPVTVTNAGAGFSRSSGPFAPGARVLATHASNQNLGMVVVAEPGDLLLDGLPAVGKRAFLYLYDETWLNTTATGKRIFDNTVAWTLGEVIAGFTSQQEVGRSLSIQFSDMSTGPVFDWTWDFGDGQSSTQRHPLHTYAIPGEYHVTLTVGGYGLGNTSVYGTDIQVAGMARGDFDLDTDVDMSDYGFFQGCYSGSGLPLTSEACQQADFDGDNDVDAEDYGRFADCMSGPGIPADPACGSW